VARKAGTRLDPAQIVETALDLLDEVGLDGLSTRLIAERMGVKQPALYWHFTNRQALLDAMNNGLMQRRVEREPREGEAWDAFLLRNTRSFRAALLSRRDGARVHAGTQADPEEVELVEQQLAVLVAAGFSAGSALDVLVATSRYTVGCVLEEQAENQRSEDPGLREAAASFPLTSAAIAHYDEQGHENAFEDGLSMLVEGARAKLRHR
jgi:TetR/AcrR family tetracycline transcriptional repressor